jgi:hypothetical protein
VIDSHLDNAVTALGELDVRLAPASFALLLLLLNWSLCSRAACSLSLRAALPSHVLSRTNCPMA